MTNFEFTASEIESKIYLIRGEKVMLDYDLAELYQVQTKRLKEQVKRNLPRFPADFMFVLSNQELSILRSQFATSRLRHGGQRIAPLAFTEQGVTMLSAVLHSERAIDVNITIVRAFVRLRQVLNPNTELEKKILELECKYDGKFKIVFEAIREMMSTHAVPRRRVAGLDPSRNP